MRKRLLPIALVGTFFVFLLNFSCTKLDTTTLGGDLIPVVDNVNTFSDTFDIVTTQGIFDDTTKVSSSEYQVLGKINNDPLFGTTDAALYVQMKPNFFPFYFGNAGDTLFSSVDSVVLCLSYVGVWGDSTKPQDLEVRQVLDNNFATDLSVRNVNYTAPTGPLLGSARIDIPSLRNQVKINHGKDSAVNQIRIKLSSASFINSLYGRDSILANTTNNAFRSDSMFRQFYNGFEIRATDASSNSLLYINLADANTGLEVYYRKNRGVPDSVYSVFPVYGSTSVYPSATANSIQRVRPGTFPAAGTVGGDVYLQTAPGTFANLRVPALDTFKNRIIHRAEILMQQVPADPVLDSILSVPQFLYLDLVDTPAIASKWKPLYYDLNPASSYDPDNKSGLPYYPSSAPSPSYFGGVPFYKTDGSGVTTINYSFNITRYIQKKVTQQIPNYTMRLFPAFNIIYPQYAATVFPYFNNVARGRVRLAGGDNSDKNKKMRMVVIWSNIK